MGAAQASGGRLPSVGLPRTRVLVVGALLAVFAVLVFALVWGPLNGRGTVSDNASPMALLNAGIAAQSAGRLPEATSDYQKVLAKDPNNFWALYDLGVIEQASAKSATAESYYRRALTINPAFVPALYNLAIIRTPVNPQEAEALYRSAIAAQPGAATSHLNLGFLLLHEGKQADGQAELRLAVKYDPSLAARVPAAILSPAASHKP